MSPPVMRGMIHNFARQGIFLGLAAGLASTATFYYSFVKPRQQKYEDFFKSYDPYTRMREICEVNKGYMHTCPQELVKMYEEKGKSIGSKDGAKKVVAAAELEAPADLFVAADQEEQN
uniref:COX6C domain-containing protein n=1 Tax=Rhabditophanes sp. KR3021 TaxID=114890 RepID=A0AC35TZV0_9BILA